MDSRHDAESGAVRALPQECHQNGGTPASMGLDRSASTATFSSSYASCWAPPVRGGRVDCRPLWVVVWPVRPAAQPPGEWTRVGCRVPVVRLAIPP